MSLISLYQSEPANPLHVGALLGALDRVIRYITRTYAEALGGYADAKQDVYAALLGVAKSYDTINKSTGVELHLLGDTANALGAKVNRGIKAATKEVSLDELPERTAVIDLARVDLSLALKRKVVRKEDLPLLRLYLDGKSYAQIGKLLTPKITEKAVERRLEKAVNRLQEWASEKK